MLLAVAKYDVHDGSMRCVHLLAVCKILEGRCFCLRKVCQALFVVLSIIVAYTEYIFIFQVPFMRGLLIRNQ